LAIRQEQLVHARPSLGSDWQIRTCVSAGFGNPAGAASSRQEQVWETAGATFLINFACTKAGFMIEDMKYENSWKGT